MLSDLNTLSPACLTLVSAIILTKSHLELNIENITEKGGDTIERFAAQKADAVIGSVALFISFIWQLINLTIPVTWEFGRLSLCSVAISLLLTIIMFGCCYAASKKLAKVMLMNAISRREAR